MLGIGDVPGRRAGAIVALAAALVLVAPAGAAAQEEPPFVDWTPLLPSVPGEHRPSEESDCVDGDPACVDRTIAEMNHRIHNVVPVCHHDVVFAVTYLRVTGAYRTADRAGYFDEPDFLAHEDAVFARMYFEAYDAWRAGREDQVAPAWRLAFGSAERREVNGLGNILMGINAHVNRDMPFMLARIGLIKPDGSSRKPDHDRLNRLLNRLLFPVLREVAARFDPSTDDVLFSGTGLEGTAYFQTLQSMREITWRNAERLVMARNESERERVARSIERYAVAVGEMIRAGTRIEDSSTRDGWCAVYGGQRPHQLTGAPPGVARPLIHHRLVRASRGGGVALLRLACRGGRGGCAGLIGLQAGRRGTLVGLGSYRIAPGQARTARIRLSRAAAWHLRRRGAFWSRLTITRRGVKGERRVSRGAVGVVRPRG